MVLSQVFIAYLVPVKLKMTNLPFILLFFNFLLSVLIYLPRENDNPQEPSLQFCLKLFWDDIHSDTTGTIYVILF